MYEPGKKDVFGNPNPSRAHVFLDGHTCAPAWGHAAEGATGKIAVVDDEKKNYIRLARVMGMGTNGEGSLRLSIHNYVSLPADHKVYFDEWPQLMLIPLLGIEQIKQWKEDTPYDVAVLVSSAPHAPENMRMEVEQVYTRFLWDFPYDDLQENGTPGTCTYDDLSLAFTVLRHFITFLIDSLNNEIPQQLIKLVHKVTNTSGGSSRGNVRDGSGGPPFSHQSSGSSANSSQGSRNKWLKKEEEINTAMNNIPKQSFLPKLKAKQDLEPLPKVLKVRFSANEGFGNHVPDPWLLMAKAAVNFSYSAYGCKLLPACIPSPGESNEESEEEERPIPLTLFIPASTGDVPAAGTPTGASGLPCFVTPPRHTDGGEELWENLSD